MFSCVLDASIDPTTTTVTSAYHDIDGNLRIVIYRYYKIIAVSELWLNAKKSLHCYLVVLERALLKCTVGLPVISISNTHSGLLMFSFGLFYFGTAL